MTDDDLQIISIVRNPYEKVLSDLFWFKKIKETDSTETIYECIRNYLYNFEWDHHTLPQYKFLIDKDGKMLDNVKIFHTENLTNELREYGFSDFNNHFYKSNKNDLYPKLLNDKSKEMIYLFYKEDFELFNYSKDYN